jgi:hypothetical protein
MIARGRIRSHERCVWLWCGQIKKKQTDLERGEKRLKSLQTVRYAID